MKMKITPFLAAALMLTSFSSRAALIIADDFNDANLGTNSTGTGTGFDSVGQNPFTESGGFASSAPGGSATTVLTSKDSFDAFQVGTTTRTTWNINNAHLGQSQYRTWVGIRAASSNSDHFLPGVQGMYIKIFSHDVGNGSYEGNLFATNQSGGSTLLAGWAWDSFNPGSGANTGLLDIVLDTSSTDYSLSFSQSTTLQFGNLTGSTSAIGSLGTLYEVGAHNQWSGNTIAFDGISVETLEDTAVPLPGVLSLFGLGLLGLHRRLTSLT